MFTLTSLRFVLVGDPLEHRRNRVTRPTPLGPEVDEHGLVGLQDLGLEGGVSDVRCHSFLSVALTEASLPRLPRVRTRQPRLAFPMPEPIFQPLPDKPDHPALEQGMLARWEAEGTFAKLREQNRGGPTFSFIDGPVTANRPARRPHDLGRTLKDVFQRYKALRGFDQRYQNGFDCQGLWIEVGVERELGLNSKHEIEEYGLEKFARACRDVVAEFAGSADRAVEATRPVDGLGQRLLHLQRHEHRVRLADAQVGPRARLALQRPPLDAVVPALRHVDLAARADRRGELRRARAPVALRPLPAARAAGSSRSSSGRRPRGRCPRTSPRP